MNNEDVVYYWECCDKHEDSESLHAARLALEKHEKECHNSKMVGRFGIERK